MKYITKIGSLIWAFDAEHERKRKLQLTKLFDRTQEKASQTYYKLKKSPLKGLCIF
jgi:hypothetical protein